MISKNDIYAYKDLSRVLLHTSEFICISPHLGLKRYTSNYSFAFLSKNFIPDGFTIMPSGCATFTITKSSSNLFFSVDGPTLKPYIVGSENNQIEMEIAIEFKPAGLYALTGITQSELTDSTNPFDAVDPKLTKLILDTIEQTNNINELVAKLDILLLHSVCAEYNPQLKVAFQSIFAGVYSAKTLSDETHYSERQLNRIFQQHVGLNAKAFARLVRFYKVVRLMKKPFNSLAFISDAADFYDFSHFSREFKLVCGKTPQEFRDNMSDFYINTTKI